MSHREQFIWKRSVELCVICYHLTKNFPTSELYGLTNQTTVWLKVEFNCGNL